MKTFAFKKIIRDKLYQKLLHDNDIKINKKDLTKQEFIEKLKDKLIEESLEVKDAKELEEIKEELADVLEVIQGLIKIHNLNFEDIEKIRKNKFQEKGGFENPIYINSISVDNSHSNINYFLKRKEKYPEII